MTKPPKTLPESRSPSRPIRLNNWGILILGYHAFVGYIIEVRAAGKDWFRVHVPETGRAPEFTRLFPADRVKGISEVPEQVALELARRLQQTPTDEPEREAVSKAFQDVATATADLNVEQDIPDDWDENDCWEPVG